MMKTGVQDDSYMAKLKKRRDDILKAREDAQVKADLSAQQQANQLTQDQVTQKLREYNINLIRQGKDPTDPITLTPEEDAQLVKEGVLPVQ